MERYDIENIEPKEVLFWFKKICEIPHGSYHEEAISKYISEICNKFCDKVKVYPSGMIMAYQKATPGYENRTTVLLQAHMDMVLAKTTDCPKDLEKEHIDVYYDPEKHIISAQKTTLGADNGLGVASMLAIMENKNNDIAHGPIEYCFTVNEEDKPGTCIQEWKAEDSKARYYLNLDGESTDELVYGAAGTATAKYDNPVIYIDKDMSYPTFHISLTGFRGGHSGSDIHKPHINAITFLAETLLSFAKTYNTTVCLTHFHGGPINNAIPIFAHCDVNIEEKHVGNLQAWFQKALDIARKVAQGCENNIQAEITRADQQATKCLSVQDTLKVLTAIAFCPNKVFVPSIDLNLMYSSSNIGLALLDEKTSTLKVDYKIRGFVDDDIVNNACKMQCFMESFGFPNYNLQGVCSSFINDVKANAAALAWGREYKKVTGKNLKMLVIGAGLELAEFCKIKPELTANTVSVGPTILKPHSPDEIAFVDDLKIFWTIIKNFLKNIL